MSDKKEPIEKKSEPGLPVNIPMSIVRWFCYSVLFMMLIAPFVIGSQFGNFKMAFGGLILGHFASQLNALIKKP